MPYSFNMAYKYTARKPKVSFFLFSYLPVDTCRLKEYKNGMKHGKLFVVSAALLMIVSLCGCEVDSASRKIEVRPDSATLRYKESVTLTAYNGYIYAWSLQNETYGKLSSRSGMMVTYTSMSDPATPQLQIITVTSTFSDNSDSGSGSNPVSHTAEAYITHISATSDLASASSAQ